jgi:hypothetical protein
VSLNRPELLFVSGPQDGERAMPESAQVIAGRSASADIFISEQSASRQQFQLTFTEDGWVFENLSSAGTKVNGKKCKSGKKLILGTGDVISAGGETQILFVHQGDDPDQALRAYREKHPQAAPPPPPPEDDKKAAGKDKPKQMPSFAPSRPPLPGEKSGAIVTRQASPPPVVADLKPLTPFSSASSRPRAEVAGPATGRLEKSPADLRKAKLRKYAVMALVYGLALMGLIIILSTLRGGDESSDPEGMPTVMKPDEIRDKLMDRPTV